MTRYCLKPLPEHTHIYEVSIGWDPSLATFFAAVFGQPDDFDDPVILRAIGTSYKEIDHPATVITLARQLAEMPNDIFRTLSLDAKRHPGSQNPPSDTISRLLLVNRLATPPA